jgi:bacillithiol system protein YtxJ
MVVELRQERDLEQLLQYSHKDPVVIFKHSTQCSRSAGAYEEYETFMADHPGTLCGTVLVIEDREISDELEDRFGIRHESPQAIVVSNGNPTWHANHFKVTARALEEAVAAAAKQVH